MMQIMPERESVKVLEECKAVQIKKSLDYQNPLSTVKQADHYPHGVQTIMDMVHQKNLRAKSLFEATQYAPGSTPNFESIEDTLKDMINYLSFAVSYMRGKMDGQNPNNDMYNRPKNQNVNGIETLVSNNPTITTGVVYTTLDEFEKQQSTLTPQSVELSVNQISTGVLSGKRDPLAEALTEVLIDTGDAVIPQEDLVTRTAKLTDVLTEEVVKFEPTVVTHIEQGEGDEIPLHRLEMDADGQMIATPIMRTARK
jgi:hypothetical protein